MADEQKNNGVLWIVGLLIAAVISAGAAVYSQSGKTSQANQQSIIDNLPAVIAQLDVLKEEVDALQDSTLSAGEIEARFAALVERLSALEGQLTRRFNEVVQQPMHILRRDVEDNENHVASLRESVAELKAQVDALDAP